MRRILSLFAVTSGLVTSLLAAQPAQQHFDGQTWWNHVKVLADDNMEGRETGSAGLRRAQAYIVAQLTQAGLQPAGVNGFYQPVKLVQRQIDEKNSSAALVRDGKAEPLVLGEDAFFNTRAELAAGEVTAPLVFAGYGLRVPENHFDDFAGLDLRGKIVVLLAGSPADVPGPLASHYQTPGERWKALKATGAIGIVTIPNPASMDIPWSRMSLNRAHASMDLAGPEFNETAGLRMSLTFNPAQAEKLFAGSGHTFAELAALGKDRKPLPRFPLIASLKAHASVKQSEVESANVLARLPGTDPKLAGEVVVLSAHVDHVGIGEPIDGDRIYNGAMDDGSGSALLLDMAANLKKSPAAKPRRSILFAFVTAEEKGLLGSKYFAAHPTVAAKSIVADVNVDMFLPIVPLKVLKVGGIAESDLGDRAAAIARSLGVKPIADPEPLRNLFIRSDQYSFIRHGVPSLKMDVGFELGSPEQQIFKEWLTKRYHAPSDDLSQPVDLGAAALYEEITRRLLLDVANADARPAWKADSFFRRYAAGGGASSGRPAFLTRRKSYGTVA
ncbi:MAG TPA: M28 family metallopeptidase [Thermoanaerobaculia bacterium]|nr:M28 family metallopeptidase [Thermoanaerobaculia bacterium]